MIFIRWSGYGIFAPLIILIGAFGVTSVTKALYGPSFIAGHPWAPCLGFALGGLLCWWTGTSLNSDTSRTLVDERTHQRVVLRRSHTLYGIPMQWWGVAAMLGGLFFVVTGLPVAATFSRLGLGRNSPVTEPAASAPAVSQPISTVASSQRVQPSAFASADRVAPQIPRALSSQQAAVRLYPSLGVAGSPFNARFLALHKRYLVDKPDYFGDPDWPVKLAREVAGGAR